MGQALHGVFQKLRELGLSSLPDSAEQALRETVQTRNFVAHRYFVERELLAKDSNALPALIAELEWFSELFDTWVPTLDKWSDMLIKALGMTDDDLRVAQSAVQEAVPDLQREHLSNLKNQLARIGVEVPAPSPQRPNTPLQPTAEKRGG